MKRKCEALKKWESNLRRWIDGDWENVWQKACFIKQRRDNIMRSRAKGKKKPSVVKHNAKEEAALKTWIRAKTLINDGEFSKAPREINEAGVAEPLPLIVEQLRRKYPKRSDEVRWPDDEEIKKEIEDANMLQKRSKNVDEIIIYSEGDPK